MPAGACFYFELGVELIAFIYLYVMCFLCIDKCFQLNFPICYRNHVTNKTSVLVVALIVFCQVIIFGYRIFFVDHSVFNACSHSYTKQMIESIYIELLSLFGFCIAVCIQMTYITKKRRGQLHIEAKRMVLLNDILAVLFIFSYLPTVAHQYTLMYYEHRGHDDWHNDITELVRYVTPLSNGFALYFTRPVYKESFKLLLTTNPIKWRNIKRETLSKKMSEFSQFKRPTNTVHTPCVQKKSEKDLARPTNILGKSKSDIMELSLTNVKSDGNVKSGIVSQRSSVWKMKSGNIV